MNINYSINNSVLMMMSEFMITAFVIVILFVVISNTEMKMAVN